MALTTEADYIAAKAAGILSPIAKAVGTVSTSAKASWWTATGTPTAGAVPTAAVVCDNTLLGALTMPAVTGGNSRYIDEYLLGSNVANYTLHVVDRVIHSGGLNGTVITAQAVNTPALPARAPAASVEWFLEFYTSTGATGTTATMAVTYTDATTANLTAAVAANQAARTQVAIMPTVGKIIASVQSVTLTATTGTTGNFGITAQRRVGVAAGSYVAGIPDRLASMLNNTPTNACLALVSEIGTTASTTATCNGYLKLIEG
jgi:hypothetical protein